MLTVSVGTGDVDDTDIGVQLKFYSFALIVVSLYLINTFGNFIFHF
jgi:hypothetical protein